MGRNAISTMMAPVLIFLVQVLVLKDIVLYGYAFCFLYVFLILLLPMDMNPLAQLISAFVIGILVDVFYNTPGLHASACVLMVFLKVYWLQIMTPSGGYDSGARINVRTQGLQWFLGYSFPLILAHSLVLFFVEASGFSMFWSTLGKAFYSALFTLVMILIVQYLFYKKVR